MLVKLRPAILPLVVGALKQWTPAALNGLPASNIKSVEKTIRILLMHISRYLPSQKSRPISRSLFRNRMPVHTQFLPQINEILAQQGLRMDKAASEERKRKATALASASDNRKRPSSTPVDPTEPKRPKLELDNAANASFLSAFDFTSLPAGLITELIVANLEAFTEPTLIGLVQAFRESRGLGAPVSPSAPTLGQALPTLERDTSLLPAPRVRQEDSRMGTPQLRQPDSLPTPETAAGPAIKDEPVDPLQMDIDQDEIEYEPDRLNEEV